MTRPVKRRKQTAKERVLALRRFEPDIEGDMGCEYATMEQNRYGEWLKRRDVLSVLRPAFPPARLRRSSNNQRKK